MKILHTADWHLGKRLDSFSRIEEQVQVMDEICQIAEREQVDMVIVAGDLFDAFHPSVEAIELLYKTLKRLAADGTRPVVAIAGNHDSTGLIDAPDPLARECGIIMIGSPLHIVPEMKLKDFCITKSEAGFFELKMNHLDYPIRILHTPYANEARLHAYFDSEKAMMLNQLLSDSWNTLAEKYCDVLGVNILTAHLFVVGMDGIIPEEPEGEKPIRIGNADMIYTSNIPHQIQYTALGHLHAFQNVGTDDRPIMYSSSPLSYSFSEAGQKKYAVIIDVQPDQSAKYVKVELRKGRKLYRKTFDDIEIAIQWLEQHPDALLELTIVSDTFLSAEDRQRLIKAHDGIIHIIPSIKNLPMNNDKVTNINLNQDIKMLFRDYFKSKNMNQEPGDEIMLLFDEILQKS
ncbi:MAG: exonuclease SbcCD subunit D [Bacteroidia bacterium]|nr:MAG: exonuclease SbcCD subunit D [Bacteroidia bacterium]